MKTPALIVRSGNNSNVMLGPARPPEIRIFNLWFDFDPQESEAAS